MQGMSIFFLENIGPERRGPEARQAFIRTKQFVRLASPGTDRISVIPQGHGQACICNLHVSRREGGGLVETMLASGAMPRKRLARHQHRCGTSPWLGAPGGHAACDFDNHQHVPLQVKIASLRFFISSREAWPKSLSCTYYQAGQTLRDRRAFGRFIRLRLCPA